MPDTPKIQAVVFDIDDTLYPEREFVRSGYEAVAEDLRSQRGDDEPYEEWLWQRFCGGQSAGAFDALSEHYFLDLSPEDIRRLVELYRFHEPKIQAYAGMAELLGELAEDALLGVVSDGPARMQANKLDALGLRDCFRAVILTDELGPDAGKPSPKGFEAVRERLGVAHDQCAYIADNPAKDFLAPNRLGWLSVHYLRDGQLYAEVPPPPGGAARVAVRSDRELLNQLGRG
jgi:putative hydrolase of the HAD superfamily